MAWRARASRIIRVCTSPYQLFETSNLSISLLTLPSPLRNRASRSFRTLSLLKLWCSTRLPCRGSLQGYRTYTEAPKRSRQVKYVSLLACHCPCNFWIFMHAGMAFGVLSLFQPQESGGEDPFVWLDLGRVVMGEWVGPSCPFPSLLG